jgi:hypothetical protein
MTNGLRNHPGPGTRIKGWDVEQRWKRIHRRFWFCYVIVLTCVGIVLYHR